jgi:hypothetical protein
MYNFVEREREISREQEMWGNHRALSSGLLKIKKRNKNLILIKKNTPLEIF